MSKFCVLKYTYFFLTFSRCSRITLILLVAEKKVWTLWKPFSHNIVSKIKINSKRLLLLCFQTIKIKIANKWEIENKIN